MSEELVPIEDDDDGDDPTCWDGVTPKMDNEITSDDFKGDQHSLEDKEVVARGDSEGLVNISTSKADEWRGDGEISDHFSHS